MKYLLCAIGLCAMALFMNFVQADREQDFIDELRYVQCHLKSQKCRNQMVTKVTDEDVMGLCNAKPVLNASSKCLMDCQMSVYHWINDKGFQKDKYIEYIKNTEMGEDASYVEAAQVVADICKDKKASVSDSCEIAYLIIKCLQDEGDRRQKPNLGYGIFYVQPLPYIDLPRRL